MFALEMVIDVYAEGRLNAEVPHPASRDSAGKAGRECKMLESVPSGGGAAHPEGSPHLSVGRSRQARPSRRKSGAPLFPGLSPSDAAMEASRR